MRNASLVVAEEQDCFY